MSYTITSRTQGTGVLPLDVPEGFDQMVKKFSFDWTQLKQVLENEMHHFAVKSSPGCIHVFTRHCTFRIDLRSAEGNVALTESIWMAELLALKQQIHEADKKTEEAQRSARYSENDNYSLRTERDRMSTKIRLLQEEKAALAGQLKAETSLRKSWTSRFMRMIRKSRKT